MVLANSFNTPEDEALDHTELKDSLGQNKTLSQKNTNKKKFFLISLKYGTAQELSVSLGYTVGNPVCPLNKQTNKNLGLVAQAYNSRTCEVLAGGLQIQDQPKCDLVLK